MSLHYLQIRCGECRVTYSLRRPNNSLLIAGIVEHAVCPHCHPEELVKVCAACRLPFIVVPHHSRGMCFTCFQRARRSLQSELPD